MDSARLHIEEIERVALGHVSPRDSAVVQSWLRCLNDYRMNPAHAQEAYIVPAHQLREHQEQAGELIRIGRSGLETLFRNVADQNYVLLLSDARGVTVDFMGDATFDNHLRKAGLYLGSEWSENRAGTCAVGACIVSGAPVIIHQDDHFDTSHIGLTCTAAPIFDTLGDLTAVLDISQLRSPTVKASQRLALHLVSTTARRIEFANLLARARHEWVLRLSRSPDFLDVDPDAALAIDGRGRISGLTHGGFAALARAMKMSAPATRALVGLPLSQLFDIDVDDLPRLTRGRPAGDRVVRTRDGVAIFASAIAPALRPKPAPRPPAPAPAATPAPLAGLAFGDPTMEAQLARAARLGAAKIPILIHGETGAGKEYLARAIHDSSPRPGRFVPVNCAAIPEHLIEAELFGYAPGAFTGALPKGKPGLIEAANGGTLFLDEIGDMPLTLQSRFLRVLSENEVTPVGGREPRAVSFRLISASHLRLDALVRERRFREDLYYRLNAGTLTLPPLRLRADLGALIDRWLARFSSEAGRDWRLTPAARLALMAHTWPGNLRELANALRVATALADGSDIDIEHLPESLHPGAVRPAATPPGASPAALPPQAALLAELEAAGGNVSELARRSGLHRATVHRRLNRLGKG